MKILFQQLLISHHLKFYLTIVMDKAIRIFGILSVSRCQSHNSKNVKKTLIEQHSKVVVLTGVNVQVTLIIDFLLSHYV